MSFQRILGFGVLIFLGVHATAQVTWTGVGADGNFTTPANWSATLPNDGTANVTFGVSTATTPVVNASFSFNSIVYQAGSPSFFVANSGGAGLTVASSISQLSNVYQTITAPLTVGPSFTFSGSGSTTYLNVNGGITAPSGFAVRSGADVRVGGGWNVTGPITVDPGSVLEFVNSNASLANAITNNGALGFGNGTNTLSYGGAISGTGSVTINSPTTFTTANTYSGGTTISGTLQVTNPSGSATGTGPISIANTGRLEVGTGGNAGAVSGTIVNHGVITFNRSDAISVGGISGTGSLHQVGTGTLTLLTSTPNSYSGSTVVEAGVLTDAGAGAFPSNGEMLIGAGTLQVGYNESIRLGDLNASAGTGTVTIQPGVTLTLSGGRPYSGTITGGGSLLIANGFPMLTGTINHTGGTTIAATGFLTIGSGESFASVTGDIVNNGRLMFSQPATGGTYAGKISGSGVLYVGDPEASTSGVLTLSGANSYTGATVINAGTLRIGAANTLPTSTALRFADYATLDVATNQTIGSVDAQDFGASILLGTGATLTIAPALGNYGGTFNGMISGSGNLVFAGAANTSMSLNNTNTYTGSTTVTGGTVYVTDNAFGSGQVTLQTGSRVSVGKGSQATTTLPNTFVLSDQVTLSGAGDRMLVLGATVKVPTGSSTVHVGDYVRFSGALASAAGTSFLTIDSAPGTFAHAVLTGPVNPTGASGTISGFSVNTAGVIFGSTAAVPAAPFTIRGSNAYIGLANMSVSAPTPGAVLNLIDKPNFTGVLGFDTLVQDSAPTVFPDPVSLTGFGSTVSLGSATSAVLSGTITPDGDYRFGNGGGALIVTSQLTGNRGLIVNSSPTIPGNHLTLVLRNTGTDVNGNWVSLPANDFTGSVSITNSLVVLDSAAALPAGRAVTLGANGYLGYTEAFTGNYNFGDFVNTRLVAGGYTPTSVIGIDSHSFANDQIRFGYSYSDRWFNDTIDLRALSPIYLGTVTGVTLHGVIFAPTQGGANKTLSLLAAGDGTLTVESPLRAGNVGSVVVGASGSPYANGTVALKGANTYSGGTTLQSGTLLVGQNNMTGAGVGPLGSGVLTVPATAKKPVLSVADYSYGLITNSIVLGSSLQIGLPNMTPPAYSTTSGGPSAFNSYGSGSLLLNGIIGDLDASNRGSLDIYTPTQLNAPNTFSGGVTLHDTMLALGSDAALGSGTLALTSSPTTYGYNTGTLATYNGPRTIGNNLVYSGIPRGTVAFAGTGSFTFTGSFALNNDVTLAPDARPVYFNGPITGTGRLLTDGSSAVILAGANTYGGGTESQYGAVVFANAAAMPATPGIGAFKAGSSGYIGIQFVPSNLQTTFIDRFDKAGTSGAVGFDSADLGSPNTFAGAINLTGFDPSARLGSTSSAILTGAITPAASYYNFGNGGGLLEVRSVLADGGLSSPRGLDVSSDYDAPLTVRLSGANTFSGGISVSNSGLIFGSGALPAAGTIVPYYQAYVGTADSGFAANPNGFINRFSASASGQIIGFDDAMVVTGAISLASFGPSGDPQVYLGTATTATINGAITLPSLQNAYRFAGYKGGHLTVGSTLSGARSVVIGNASMAATFGTPTNVNLPLSSVKLAAANTYTGGTTLAAGELVVASPTGASALGTGTLTIESTSMGGDGRHVRLLTEDSPQTVGNAIALGGDLDVGDRLGGNNLTLTGAISGTGALYKVGTDLLTISGTNTATGGLYVQGGAVTFAHGYSVGAGPLQFQNASSAAVTFNETSTVFGIAGDSFGQSIYMAPGGTFTVNQTFDAEFKGTLAVLNTPVVDVVFNGSGSTPVRLTLSGNSTYTTSGTTKINSGITILAANANAFGPSTNTVTLNGGQLAVGNGVVLANPLSLASGNLAGNGTFKAPAASGGYTIGSNLVLSPGVAGPGDLKMDMNGTTLVLAGGGKYEWDLSDAAAAGGWDKVSVTGNVSIAATPTAPFNFKIGTIGADGRLGMAANFDPAQPYSWIVLTAGSITGYTGTGQFVVDPSNFYNPSSGSFTLAQSGNSLVLNFSPIPEPSTYVLMMAGLGATFFALRRRRR